MMGSGTGNGAGEENKFLMDCKRVGLKMMYQPSRIGKLLSTDSQWFQGFNSNYFENLGWASRRVMGNVRSLLYVGYFIIAHYKIYKKEITPIVALIAYFAGWTSKR